MRLLAGEPLWRRAGYLGSLGITDPMTVRPYKSQDLDALLAVFHDSVHETASRDYTPEQLSAWAPDLVDAEAWSRRLMDQTVFVCESGHNVVGFASVEDDGHLDLLYVLPDAQRRGVARALCARIIDWCAAHKLGGVYTEASLTAVPFFESCGFGRVEEQNVQVRGVVMRNVRMSRAL